MKNGVANCLNCGTEAEYYEEDKTVSCLSCPLNMQGCTKSKKELIEAWNRLYHKFYS